MEIVDKMKKREEKWELGDVLTDGDGDFGLIVLNNIYDVCLMDITPNKERVYSTNINDRYFTEDSLTDLQNIHGTRWHKVNAKLVIE